MQQDGAFRLLARVLNRIVKSLGIQAKDKFSKFRPGINIPPGLPISKLKQKR